LFSAEDNMAKEKELQIETRPQSEVKKEEQLEIPKYKLRLKLSETQSDKLTKDVFDEFDMMVKERSSLGLEPIWETMQNLFDGESKSNDKLHFDLRTWQARIKAVAVISAMKQSFLEPDPKFNCTPRPEYAREDNYVTPQKQEDFLDYAMDEEIRPEKELHLTITDCVNKFVGIQKVEWDYETTRRRRNEKYIPELEPKIMPNGEMGAINRGVTEFLDTYPEALREYPSYVNKLVEGKEINIVVEYNDTINNSPKGRYVDIHDFYVPNSTKGYDGLRKAHLVVERQPYSYWELKDMEERGEFENVDQLIYQGAKGEKKGSDKDEEFSDYKYKMYDILECTTYLEMDGENIKIKTWMGEERKHFLGAIIYPWYLFDSDYIPYYAIENNRGFYGDCKSFLSLMKDSNIAENACLNLLLHGNYARNVLTPIVAQGSDILEQFEAKRWIDGIPLTVDEDTDDINKAINFVKYPQIDTASLESVIQFLKSQDDDVSGVSGGMTGKESPTDPRAPATKTLALLERSGINIKAYINTAAPSWTRFGCMILQMYYQMSKEGRKFKVRQRAGQITGGKIFKDITRDEMVAKTNIQTRAYVFALDKIAEKQEDMAMLQMIMSIPYFANKPNSIYEAIRTVMISYNPKWRNKVDSIVPSPEQFQQEQAQAAMQAIQAYFKGLEEQQQSTGLPAEPSIEGATQAVTTGQAVNFNPNLAEGGEGGGNPG